MEGSCSHNFFKFRIISVLLTRHYKLTWTKNGFFKLILTKTGSSKIIKGVVGDGGGGDLYHKTSFFIEIELNIKYFDIKPRLEGGSNALKFLLYIRKGVIFLKKCLSPPLPHGFPYKSLSSWIKVISETSPHKTATKTSQKLAFFSNIGCLYAA